MPYCLASQVRGKPVLSSDSWLGLSVVTSEGEPNGCPKDLVGQGGCPNSEELTGQKGGKRAPEQPEHDNGRNVETDDQHHTQLTALGHGISSGLLEQQKETE